MNKDDFIKAKAGTVGQNLIKIVKFLKKFEGKKLVKVGFYHGPESERGLFQTYPLIGIITEDKPDEINFLNFEGLFYKVAYIVEVKHKNEAVTEKEVRIEKDLFLLNQEEHE